LDFAASPILISEKALARIMILLTISKIVAGWLILSALTQYVVSWLFVRVFHRQHSAKSTLRIWPKAGILLSLRGGDEELPMALQSLLDQDYPDYELHIVVDSEQDSAWPIVHEIVAENPQSNVFVNTLHERPVTCSPHCASLAQAARSAETCEILALVDGDVVAPRNWLRTLVAGLDRQDVGMVHGNRWYRFDQTGWGSAVRYCWNSAAVVVMYLFHIPWGGSSAMRRQDMIDAGVIDAWLTTLNQDNPAKVKMKKFGKRTIFLPELMILNRDAISLPVCTEFLTRQLMWGRLYSPARHWVYLLIHGWSVLVIEAAAVGLLLYGLATGDVQLVVTNALGLGALLLAIPLALARNEKTVRNALAERGEHIPAPTLGAILGFIPKTIFTQFVYAVALYKATVRKRLKWRNVEYEILGPWQNRVADDQAA
jgi:cellulose synthase/poly-beta-1,6-N-acetylglucosamine synthase-like glycosyltransferase